jgi:hypothetical protein
LLSDPAHFIRDLAVHHTFQLCSTVCVELHDHDFSLVNRLLKSNDQQLKGSALPGRSHADHDVSSQCNYAARFVSADIPCQFSSPISYIACLCGLRVLHDAELQQLTCHVEVTTGVFRQITYLLAASMQADV